MNVLELFCDVDDFWLLDGWSLSRTHVIELFMGNSSWAAQEET